MRQLLPLRRQGGATLAPPWINAHSAHSPRSLYLPHPQGGTQVRWCIPQEADAALVASCTAAVAGANVAGANGVTFSCVAGGSEDACLAAIQNGTADLLTLGGAAQHLLRSSGLVAGPRRECAAPPPAHPGPAAAGTTGVCGMGAAPAMLSHPPCNSALQLRSAPSMLALRALLINPHLPCPTPSLLRSRLGRQGHAPCQRRLWAGADCGGCACGCLCTLPPSHGRCSRQSLQAPATACYARPDARCRHSMTLMLRHCTRSLPPSNPQPSACGCAHTSYPYEPQQPRLRLTDCASTAPPPLMLCRVLRQPHGR